MSDSACTHECTEYQRHTGDQLEKLTCRDCGMIRGERTDWLLPDPAMLVGGMEACLRSRAAASSISSGWTRSCTGLRTSGVVLENITSLGSDYLRMGPSLGHII